MSDTVTLVVDGIAHELPLVTGTPPGFKRLSCLSLLSSWQY